MPRRYRPSGTALLGDLRDDGRLALGHASVHGALHLARGHSFGTARRPSESRRVPAPASPSGNRAGSVLQIPPAAEARLRRPVFVSPELEAVESMLALCKAALRGRVGDAARGAGASAALGVVEP